MTGHAGGDRGGVATAEFYRLLISQVCQGSLAGLLVCCLNLGREIMGEKTNGVIFVRNFLKIALCIIVL